MPLRCFLPRETPFMNRILPMRTIFLGLPEAGKKTQAELLAHQWQIPYISIDSLIQQAIAEKTSLGLKARDYLGLGQQLSDHFLLALIRDRLRKPNAQQDWIIEGFPKNVIQAYTLDNFLQFLDCPCKQVFYLDVSIERLVNRLFRQRRMLGNESVMTKLVVSGKAELDPLLDFSQRRNLLEVINGNCKISDVALLIQKQLQPSVEALAASVP